MTNPAAPNSKGDLIARLISLGLGVPAFDIEISGPPHERTFHVRASVGGRVLGLGEGRSKKEAERLASEVALLALETPAAAPLLHHPAPPHQPPAAHQPPALWPIYAPVLAQAIEAALDFAPDDATLNEVQRHAAQFYQGLLLELGHGPQKPQELQELQEKE